MGKIWNMKEKKRIVQPAVSQRRFEVGFGILNQWLHLRQNGKSLLVFFEDNLIESAAIYGMGALGDRLYEELRDGPVTIPYAIDRNAAVITRHDLKIIHPDQESFPEADVIVVTPVQDYWQMVRLLERKTDAAILSLEDIVEYCMCGEER